MDEVFVSALITCLLLFITTLAFVFWRISGKKRNTVLFVGQSDSGKTVIFTKLVNQDAKWSTYTSLKENYYQGLVFGNKKLNLVDYPGSESFRGELFLKWFGKNRNDIKSVCFVVDSSTFTKKIKEIAEFLYDVLYECKNQIPVLVVCNKQDISHAKAKELIQNSLEQEFSLLNVSRELVLHSTTGDFSKKTLTEGKEFHWSDLKKRGTVIEFAECSCEEDSFSLDSVRDWLIQI